jgi:Uma2 family endonuclease
VRTLVLDPQPPELTQLLERRRQRGLDLFDEVWEGTYHMAPAPRFRHGDVDQQLAEILGPAARRVGLTAGGPFNVGRPDDYRVPDRGLLRTAPNPDDVYVRTAAMVVEIVSPGDETYDKLPFYAAHAVEEILLVDPEKRAVQLLSLVGETYEAQDRSEVIGMTVNEIAASIRWPTG